MNRCIAIQPTIQHKKRATTTGDKQTKINTINNLKVRFCTAQIYQFIAICSAAMSSSHRCDITAASALYFTPMQQFSSADQFNSSRCRV